ncbi:hypothetical protein GCM10017779_16750 [Streptomyces capillispiralis]|uniref:SH3 domain-containing protein n=1 Tax=Streptomyces capillispiralis TaxID=68182 RepID=A0A561TGP1_9ACTN|nr:hypothetical protein [Streptomyces capillispiralis]TWF86293.1 hypothetical protein FHX78_113258 [Streptomyces capillispiralis]GHH91218.1 hypothetical protein GCM10017779_16750 [Streptomyces capillispiralis]
MRNVLRATVVAGATLALGGMTLAGTAQAATAGFFLGDGVNIRSCAYTSCTVVGQGQRLQTFNVDCWTDGTSVSGSTVWVRGRNAATGVYGYASAVYVNSSGNGTPGSGDRWRYYAPHC